MIRLPTGFRASGVSCGIKKKGTDLALFVSDRPASAAARFTVNRFRAAPVLLSDEHIASNRGLVRAIVANSGCANAATGREGLAAARRTALETAHLLAASEEGPSARASKHHAGGKKAGRSASARGRATAYLVTDKDPRLSAGVSPEQILVASTGVIGERLPVDRLLAGLPAALAALSRDGFSGAARAIMTTDTRVKLAEARVRWRGREARIAGCAKGAGMIHPRMATMLAFLFMDAEVSPALLRRMLSRASGASFEAITVDGDTSTNDTVFLLANGASGLSVGAGSGVLDGLEEALGDVCASLARQIVCDGEGARRVLEVEVVGAASDREADRVAREIARSPLVKTALAGGDANWGRILAAAGAAGVRFDPSLSILRIGGVVVARAGVAAAFDRARVDRLFRSRQVEARLDVGKGPGRARILTCDLTGEYIRINADYRS